MAYYYIQSGTFKWFEAQDSLHLLQFLIASRRQPTLTLVCWEFVKLTNLPNVSMFINILKFIYSEKATKFCEIFPFLLTTVLTYSQKEGEHFAKFCGLLRIYELYQGPFGDFFFILRSWNSSYRFCYCSDNLPLENVDYKDNFLYFTIFLKTF